MNYYLIGIKGSGMSSLADILNDLGNNVAGYDDYKDVKFTEELLKKKNIKIYYDQSYEFHNDIVVYSPAIKEDHPELIRAKEANLRCLLYNELLGELTKQYETVAICGCHGKTSTTALISHVFNNMVGCNYLIGDGTGYANKGNKYLMIEACEYRRHFLYYYPKCTIITNIELDHVNYYKDLDDVKSAYVSFANQTDKYIVACGDDENIRSISTQITKPIYYYGINDNNDFTAKNIVASTDGCTFDVYFKNTLIGNFKIKLFGKHMILNAIAVIAVSYLEGLDMKTVTNYVSTFEGAKRRFQEKIVGDMVIIDDYAHHPTEVKAVIASARQKYPNKEIIGVFLPHTFSRTKALYKEIAEALNTIDKAYILDVYPSREKSVDWPGVTSSLIIDLLKNGESISRESVSKLLAHHNGVVIFMSPADLHDMIDKYTELLNMR